MINMKTQTEKNINTLKFYILYIILCKLDKQVNITCEQNNYNKAAIMQKLC